MAANVRLKALTYDDTCRALMAPWPFAASTLLLMFLVAVGTVRSGLLLRHWTPPSNLLLSVPDNLLRLVLIGVCLWVGLRWGPGPAALRPATGTAAGDLALGSGAGLFLALLAGLVGRFVIERWGETVYSHRLVRCILPAAPWEWPGVIAMFFPAAALEELLFRWLPLAGAAALPGAPSGTAWFLLWPLALFFGLLHWPQGWWGVAGTFLAAIFLSFLFLLTGSIWPPLIAHYLMNVSQLVLARASGLRPLRR